MLVCCRDAENAPLETRSTSLKDKEREKEPSQQAPAITSMLFEHDCSGDLNPFAGARVRASALAYWACSVDSPPSASPGRHS